MTVYDYGLITETPGMMVSKEQLSRFHHRYRFALELSRGKDVLEVACGSGLGLTTIASAALSVTGVDLDPGNVDVAKATCRCGNVTIRQMDALHLGFGEHCFDLILLFEAIYYLSKPELFISEAWRLLRPGGLLLICTVNKDWLDFHPSPFVTKYLSVPEIYRLLSEQFAGVSLYGAFSTDIKGGTEYLRSLLKRAAVHLNLIPGSLKARAVLKRIFVGPLSPLPMRLDADLLPFAPPDPIPSHLPDTRYKIIYGLARKA